MPVISSAESIGGGVEGSDSPRRFENAVWTMFRSGYGSITHRQADDNSFMLYARGKEVFTDAGVYNYMYKHPIRRYVRSAYAHNTIVVDGASYDYLRRDNVGLSGFCHASPLENGGYYVVGYNSLYFGVVHIRHFIYWATALVIVDELHSSSTHVYTQQFHCAPDVEVEDASVGVSTIGVPGPCGSKVVLEQIEGRDAIALRRYDGSGKSLDEPVPYGVVGGEFNEVLYTTTLTYSKTGKNVRFVTSIFVDDGVCDRTECAFDRGRGCIVLSRGGDELQVQLWRGDPADYAPNPKYKLDCVSICQAGNRLEFEYEGDLPDWVELAWYICGNYGKRILFKGVYSQNPKFSFDFSQVEDRNCTVRLFVHDRRSKLKATQMVARVTNTGDGWKWSYWPDWDETWRDWFGGTTVPSQSDDGSRDV